jgi:hypothetical protein
VGRLRPNLAGPEIICSSEREAPRVKPVGIRKTLAYLMCSKSFIQSGRGGNPDFPPRSVARWTPGSMATTEEQQDYRLVVQALTKGMSITTPF